MMLNKTIRTFLVAAIVGLFSATAAQANIKDPSEDAKNYITIGDMAEGFSEYNLPQTQNLAGKDFTIYFGDENAFSVKHTFISDKVVRWEVLTGPEAGMVGYDEYIGTNPKEGYYFVEFITGSNNAKFVSLVLDTKRDIATAVIGFFPKENEDKLSMYQRAAKKKPLTATRVEILNASIGKPMTKKTARHELRSQDLVGQRKVYQYSNKDAYEHIYLTDQLFTWNCISGNEKGLADTDFAQIIKFEKDFYMIVWVEKIMHIVSAITLNFDTMQSSGAMAAFEGWNYGEIINVSSGAKIKNLPGITAKDYELPVKRK